MAEDKRLRGLVTVITGGSRGIGKECVRMFGEYICLQSKEQTTFKPVYKGHWKVGFMSSDP
jgi:short-subunit dehydrogenase involved in D-alanine esterification of teichoic acids